jgi:hypothetical protein
MRTTIVFIFLTLLVILVSKYFKYDKNPVDATSFISITEPSVLSNSITPAHKKHEVHQYSSNMEVEYDITDEISIVSYLQDETLFDDHEIQSLKASIIESLESDPSLVYIYLDEYTYNSNVDTSEFYSTIILEAGNYDIVADYIYRNSKSNNSDYNLKLIALAASFLKDEDRLELFKRVSKSSTPSTDRTIAIISLIEPDWNDLDKYIESYVIPSLNSNNDKETLVAMIKLAKLSVGSNYIDYLMKIIDGPDGEKKDKALLALEYVPQNEILTNETE